MNPVDTAEGRAGREASLDVERLRRDFPILEKDVHGHPLVYLDNAASSQKPEAVVEALARYYRTSHANVHRGAHRLSFEATEAYEDARAAATSPSDFELVMQTLSSGEEDGPRPGGITRGGY